MTAQRVARAQGVPTKARLAVCVRVRGRVSWRPWQIAESQTDMDGGRY